MDSSSFGYYSGYSGHHSPEAKRFRHAKWNGMPEGAFAQSSPNAYYGPNVELQNQYQHGVPYSQQGGWHCSHQAGRRGFGWWSDYAANPHVMFSTSHSPFVRQPFKSGYSRGPNRLKRGSRSENQYTNKSTSDLQTRILEKLAATGHMQATELARLFSCQKKDVNHVLYSMQREGLVDKVSETPPRWSLKCQLNASSARSTSDTNSGTLKGSNMPTTCSYHMTAQSVVPLGMQAASNPSIGTSEESYDIIPAVDVEYNVPVFTDVHKFACSNSGVTSPKMVVSDNNSAQNVYEQNIACAVVSSSTTSIGNLADAATVSSISSFDIPRNNTSTVSGDLIQTVFGELKRPAGRGRGVLLLSAVKDRHTKLDSASTLPTASCEPKHDEMWLKGVHSADIGQFDSKIVPDHMKPLMPASGVNNPVSLDRITDKNIYDVTKTSTMRSEVSHGDKILTESRETSKGAGVDQPSGLFKPPLPPMQLIRTDSAYKAAVNCSFNSHFKDGGSLLLRSQSHTDDTESESYKSLSESLSSLSFRASSIPRTQSFDDLSKAYNPRHFVDCNPFAAALGIDGSSSVSALSSSFQMPEGASSLSLTGESFAALNKNSVSALMEYGQSRHVDVEIKCIGSFGPSHRPVYAFVI